MALLEAFEESICEGNQTKQVLGRGCRHCAIASGWCGHKIRPRCGDHGLASIRQDQHELQPAVPVSALHDLKRFAFERMMRTGDRHTIRIVPDVGSVWLFPSIG